VLTIAGRAVISKEDHRDLRKNLKIKKSIIKRRG